MKKMIEKRGRKMTVGRIQTTDVNGLKLVLNCCSEKKYYKDMQNVN